MRKFLVQMSGVPGAGKSTVAKLLAQSIDGIVIDHDLIRSFFLENNNDFGTAARLAYSFQWTLAGDMIRQGRSVIIDSTCNYQETLDQGTALAQRHGYHYQYVECRVTDIELIERRLRGRIPQRSQRTGVYNPPPDSNSADTSKPDVLSRFMQWIDNPVRPTHDYIVVDSTNSPEDCVGQILLQMPLPCGVSAGRPFSTDPLL